MTLDNGIHETKTVTLKKPKINVEFEKDEEGVMKVTEEFISGLRALATRQKVELNAKKFAELCGDDGKEILKLSSDSDENQINQIAEALEVIEEE
jgi:hypothetical protein